MRIDPYIASLQLLCDFVGTLNIARPDRSPKAVESIVRFHDRFFVCTEAQNRKDGAYNTRMSVGSGAKIKDLKSQNAGAGFNEMRTKRFLSNDSGILLRSVDDRRCDKISWSGWIYSANGNLVIVLFDVVEETLDSFVLHRILNGAEENIRLCTCPQLQSLRVLDHSFQEIVEYFLVHKNTFDGYADLETRLFPY